jgi:hypothetical protein
MKVMKKHVSMPSLLRRTRQQFAKVPDKESSRARLSLADCLMTGLAVFSLKYPSLLQFDDDYNSEEIIRHNLATLYDVAKAPCDTYLRERLDPIHPVELRRPFNRIFALLQRQKALEPYQYYENHYLISLDGTGCFSSPEIQCESCCVKEHKDGSKTYYHQMLGAVLVHPDQKVVIPLAPEPILKQDGARKNDCERNAAKRLIESIRREHPHLKIIITEDALASNAPHIQVLQQHNMRYILGAKPHDHKYLFDFVESVWEPRDQKEERDASGTLHRYRWVNQVPLNEANPDVLVNFLEYWEIPANGKTQHFTWVTDFTLVPSNIGFIMRGGRARWKIENETFNTLKNQGYEFEHNFGHGYHYLSTVFAYLMFLAFLIDQVQQLCCEFFNRAWKKVKRKTRLWRKISFLFCEWRILSWQDFYEGIIYGHRGTLTPNTS